MGHSIFPNISAKNQRKLQDLLLLMAEIKALGGTVKAIRYVAKKSGKSERTLYRHWIAWKKEERFELLLDKRSFNQNREFRPQVGVLPPEFVEFWRMLVEQNQRKAKPARRKLLRFNGAALFQVRKDGDEFSNCGCCSVKTLLEDGKKDFLLMM